MNLFLLLFFTVVVSCTQQTAPLNTRNPSYVSTEVYKVTNPQTKNNPTISNLTNNGKLPSNTGIQNPNSGVQIPNTGIKLPPNTQVNSNGQLIINGQVVGSALGNLQQGNVSSSTFINTQIKTNTYLPIPVGGTADCSVHINRQPGDPCGYDFCGSDADNSFLNPATYTTVKALVSYLKAQGQFPNPCTNLGVIQALGSLQTLDLSHQNISDITPLTDMINLTQLNLDFNQISDLSALSNMKDLQTLHLNNNVIINLNPLTNDTALVSLYLANNLIQTIAPLVPLKNLITLDIANNNVASILPLTNRSIGINITGNPGIITEAKSVQAVFLQESSCNLGCAWSYSTVYTFGPGIPYKNPVPLNYNFGTGIGTTP